MLHLWSTERLLYGMEWHNERSEGQNEALKLIFIWLSASLNKCSEVKWQADRDRHWGDLYSHPNLYGRTKGGRWRATQRVQSGRDEWTECECVTEQECVFVPGSSLWQRWKTGTLMVLADGSTPEEAASLSLRTRPRRDGGRGGVDKALFDWDFRPETNHEDEMQHG